MGNKITQDNLSWVILLLKNITIITIALSRLFYPKNLL